LPLKVKYQQQAPKLDTIPAGSVNQPNLPKSYLSRLRSTETPFIREAVEHCIELRGWYVRQGQLREPGSRAVKESAEYTMPAVYSGMKFAWDGAEAECLPSSIRKGCSSI
jgi:hypothetical protein